MARLTGTLSRHGTPRQDSRSRSGACARGAGPRARRTPAHAGRGQRGHGTAALGLQAGDLQRRIPGVPELEDVLDHDALGEHAEVVNYEDYH